MSTTVHVPTLAECEDAIGPAKVWAGNCYGVADALVKAGLIEGTAVYGHYLGPVHSESMFYGIGLIHHGWIMTPGHYIIDPTRWEFFQCPPYLFVGDPGHSHYDEGGQQWRIKLMVPPPSYESGKDSRIHEHLPPGAIKALASLVGNGPPWSIAQTMWLGCRPLDHLGIWAGELYSALENESLGAFIPIDNVKRVREGRWDPRANLIGGG